MEHIAIDLGGRKSQVCVRSRDGKIIEECEVETRRIGGYLSKRPKSRVLLESCAEAFGVADVAKELGHEVKVIPATIVRLLGVGERGIKTDRRDAQALSRASCLAADLPSVHVTSQISRELKSALGARATLVATRTRLINHVRGYMRSLRIRPRSGGTTTFPSRARARFLEVGPLPDFIERLLTVIHDVNAAIATADKELAQRAEENDLCRRLMTVPGVGPIVSLSFVSALDEVGRFNDAHAVQSYLGLTPGENSSSDTRRMTGITKAGPTRVRWVLVQAAWRALTTKPDDPMVRWAHGIRDRKGNGKAVVALARKIAGILYAIWRDGTTYQPLKGASSML